MRPLLVAGFVALAACNRHTTTPLSAPAETTSATPAAADSAVAPALAGGSPCGALGCVQFDSPEKAFLAAGGDGARVLAVGEAHAPKGATAMSAAKRFTQDILPALSGRTSDLLLEVMIPPTGCAGAAKEVREKQAPVTTRQAETNQNEYVQMGDRAKALGIVPDALRPSCADLDVVRDAGARTIEVSLEMIARLAGTQATRLVDRDARSDADANKAVIVYTGMLHNDLTPAPERAAWSYAPALDAHVEGHLVAIDLVVPEFIVDDDTWRSLPWYAAYDRARLGSKTTLFKTGERSFVLVFPASAP